MPHETSDHLLVERGKTHGNYTELSYMAQSLKTAMAQGRNWPSLTSRQKESLECIATKIARILTGSPNCADHWSDISGYAKLAADE